MDLTKIISYGNRGSQGYYSELTVKVINHEIEDGEITVTGEITSIFNGNGNEFENYNIGKVITVKGFYDPEYYGHDGIQL